MVNALLAFDFALVPPQHTQAGIPALPDVAVEPTV